MRNRFAVFACALLSATVAASSVAAADAPPQASANAPAQASAAPSPPPAVQRLQGTYGCQNPQAATAAIEQAIEQAVSEMSFIKRPFARSRLKDTNPVLRTFAFQFADPVLTYTYNGVHVIRTTLDAQPVRWKSPEDGNTYWVSQKRVGNKIVQTLTGSEGTKRESFELSADGRTVSYQVTITSPQLPKPVVYRYRFERK